MTRPEILAAAEKCVCGDREQDYGTPEQNFGTIANLWVDYLKGCGVEIDFLEPHDVAAMLALLKIARIASGNAKADNWIDLAGYAACGGEIESKTNKPSPAPDKPVEPWGDEDNEHQNEILCNLPNRPNCENCIFSKNAESEGLSGCEEWCKAHPAEARKIMDEMEGKAGQ